MNEFETVSFMSIFLGVFFLIMTLINNESVFYYIISIGFIVFGIFVFCLMEYIFRCELPKEDSDEKV